MIVNFEFKHDIEQVYKTITNPKFLEARAMELGSLEANSESQEIESNNQVTLIRKRKINVPSVLKAILKSVQTARTNELWSQNGDQYSCQNSTDIDGAPLKISGHIQLLPSVDGCTFKAEFETDANIPFIGKKLEKYAAKTVAKEIELECEYTAKYLAGLRN